MSWSKWLYKQLILQDTIDIIHACDYDTGATVRRFAERHNIKFIYDIFDYYIDSRPVPAALRNLIEQDEIKTINAAETTIICSEERKTQISKANPKNLVIVHNSPDIDKYEIYDEFYDYAYCGGLTNGRLIKEILDSYAANHEYKFVFAGTGYYANKAKFLDENYNEFIYKGALPYAEVIETEKRAKVISAIYEPTIRNHQLCAPNKFYEALALAKPVIVCKGTGIDKIVQDKNIGIVINYSANEFYSALQKLCTNDNARREMGIRGRELYEKNYKWSIMKNRLLEVYQNFFNPINYYE